MAKPKEYHIPSRDWPITAQEASDILVQAKEVQKNKALYKAAIACLKKKKAAMDEVT